MERDPSIDSFFLEEEQGEVAEKTRVQEASLDQVKKDSFARALEKEDQSARIRKKSKKTRRARIWSKFWNQAPWVRKCMMGSLLVFLIVVVLLLPPFYIHKIKVEGLHTLRAHDLVRASGLRFGQHMLKGMGGSLEDWLSLRYRDAEQRLRMQFPEIEQVQIKPDASGEVTIRVQERIPVAYLKKGDSYLAVDSEAYVLKVLKQAPEHMPVLEGLSPQGVQVGKTLGHHYRRAIVDAAQIVAMILDTDQEAQDHWKFLDQVKSVRTINRTEHYLVVARKDQSDLLVRLGTVEKMHPQIVWLREACHRGVFAHLQEGLLDLSSLYPIFRPGQQFQMGDPQKREKKDSDSASRQSDPLEQADAPEGTVNSESGQEIEGLQEVGDLNTDELDQIDSTEEHVQSEKRNRTERTKQIEEAEQTQQSDEFLQEVGSLEP